MATYYVDPAASGANDGSSWADAWEDVQTAFDTATAGDTVYCRGTQTLSSHIDIDTNSGDTTSGYINFIGCDAAGTARAGQFIIDADSAVDYCLDVGDIDYIKIENFDLINATSYGIYAGTQDMHYCYLRKVRCMNNATGAYFYRIQRSLVFQCVFANNTSDGIWRSTSDDWTIIFCRINGNGGNGIKDSRVSLSHCLIYENTGDGISMDLAGQRILNCVFDSNGNGSTASGVICPSGTNGQTFMLCRFTNNTDHGIEQVDGSGDESNTEMWNVFYGNTNGDLQNVTSSDTSYGDGANHISDPTSDGYVDSANDNYNVEDGKENDSTEINLFWDS